MSAAQEIAPSEALTPEQLLRQQVDIGVRFLTTVFDPADRVLIRPIETWTENGRRRSWVDYERVGYYLAKPELLGLVLLRTIPITEEKKTNLFFGVCPRFGAAGQFDQAWQIRNVRTVWTDIDHAQVDEALARASAARLPEPSIVVDSGNGAHLYWLLEEPYRIDDVGDPIPVETEWIQGQSGKKEAHRFIAEAGQKIPVDKIRGTERLSARARRFQNILQGLARSFGGDHTFDLSRLLRVPGTLNRKNQRNGAKPKPTSLLTCDPQLRYSLAVFERFAESRPAKASPRHRKTASPPGQTSSSGPAPNEEPLLVTRWTRLRRWLDASRDAPPGQRSETDYALCCEARRLGISGEELWPVVASLGKFAEGGTRYFKLTWAKAVEAVRAPKEQLTIDAGQKNLETISKQGWDALEEANRPARLFRHGSHASRIENDDRGEPLIRRLTEDRLRHELARAARWVVYKETENGTEEFDAMPPRDVVRDMLATPRVPLPLLTRIVEAPVFARDGTIQTEPGYHSASHTYYAAAPELIVPPIAERPTSAEVREAARLIQEELLGDFPFVSESCRAHAIAILLHPFAREFIQGPTPLHLVHKSTPGTGGTLLADVLTYPSTGRPLAVITEGRDEDEWRKRLTAKLAGGPQYLLIDNLRRSLDCAALASMITSPIWEDRILGASEIVRLPVNCCFLATGNNPTVSSEIARRSIPTRLDARVDRPWLRQSFRHDDLRCWARAHRGELIWAALTLIRHWHVAGQPAGGVRLGMFESWSDVMGGILKQAGIPGFLANLNEFYEEADTEGAAWRAFIGSWWQTHGSEEVTAGTLWELAVELLPLGRGAEQAQKTRLGKLLAEKRERVFGIETEGGSWQLRIVRSGQRHRAQIWKLECLAKPGSAQPCEVVRSDEVVSPNTHACVRTRAHEDRVESPRSTSPTSHAIDPEDCFHEWVDEAHAGGVRCVCRVCGKFLGYVHSQEQEANGHED
jgi:hypothetical protein